MTATDCGQDDGNDSNGRGGDERKSFRVFALRSGCRHSFCAGGRMSKHAVIMTIDDADHYTDEQKAEIIASYSAHERDARTRGIPAMGSGLIYPVARSDIEVEPFKIPSHWCIINALDIGWEHPTAAVQLAWDRDNDVVYVIREYRRQHATPLEHAATLKYWGPYPWAWPADANRRDARSGMQIRLDYESHGLSMLAKRAQFPDGGNGVEAGIMQILERMQSQRFFVFRTLRGWWQEHSTYHRKDGVVTEVNDDLMDATRYAIMMLRFASPNYDLMEEEDEQLGYGNENDSGYG